MKPEQDSTSNKGSSVYRFSTFQELVDRVPGDRIRDCMEELGTVLATAKLSTQLTYGVARNLAKADGKELPPEPDQPIVLPPEFEWVDDGKRELEARMVDAKGDGLFTVKISPNNEVSGAGATTNNDNNKSATRQRSLD